MSNFCGLAAKKREEKIGVNGMGSLDPGSPSPQKARENNHPNLKRRCLTDKALRNEVFSHL